MKAKLHIKKGDLVKVLAGDQKGQQGRILRVFRDEQKALVEGINMIHKHTKPNAKLTQGGIVQKESPVHISNLMVVDGKGNASRTGRKVKDTKIVRYSKKSGEEMK